MSFAENLVLIREAQHISRRQFADALGVTTAAVANYETGKREPNLTTLRTIANYFMVTLDDLLAETPSTETLWFIQMQNFLKRINFRVDDIGPETCILYYIGTSSHDAPLVNTMPHCRIALSLLKELYDNRFQAVTKFFSESLYKTFVCELAKNSTTV